MMNNISKQKKKKKKKASTLDCNPVFCSMLASIFTAFQGEGQYSHSTEENTEASDPKYMTSKLN
jgi:hypothetical protein